MYKIKIEVDEKGRYRARVTSTRKYINKYDEQ